MKELPKKYDTTETESRWQAAWEQNGVYRWDESESRENTYVIDTPPPTVSGLLHMGHIFSYTQADFIARYQRMKGKTVFYPMGFDDNGLPTERLVEKQKKIRAGQYIAEHGRDAFVSLCKEVVKESEEEFRTLFRHVALSVDWSQEYQTISEHTRRISQLSFLDLVRKNQVEQKLQPMLWDPIDQTAIAQAEVEDKETDSFMYHFLFSVEGSDEKLEIASTRPELLPACVAVLYHPDDERYQHLKGKTAITAVFGVKVPIIPDEDVKMDKGTGILMCCTFGDEKDIAWWKRHNLPMRIVLNQYGKLDISSLRHPERNDSMSWSEGSRVVEPDSSQARDTKGLDPRVKPEDDGIPSGLDGLKARTDGRAKVIEMLDTEGLLVKKDPIRHVEPCAERSGAPLEYLPTRQWFVKVLDKKEAFLKRSAELNWYPKHMQVRMDQWIDGLNWDWCISRQRYFGVPFPVWYSKRAGEEGKLLFAEPDQLPVDPMTDLPKGYAREEVEADTDVMDTWATSSVSPQISSWGITTSPLRGEVESATAVSGEGGEKNTSMPPSPNPLPSRERALNEAPFILDPARHAKLFPADLRPQAHEIIRTWAFYTLAKAHMHEDCLPWHNVMISGWCLAADKTKMSKSKGNVVTPTKLLEEKGSDVVRYWASTSRLGADTAYSEDVMAIGRKLVTKLWNAVKFAAIQMEKIDATPAPSMTAAQAVADGKIHDTLDLWILSKLHKTVAKATTALETYEYCEAREHIERFFWADFCDNYLELVKARAYGEEDIDPGSQQSAIHAIFHCTEALLRLFAPYLPHITEELYSHIFDARHAAMGSIHARGTWPNAADYPENDKAEVSGDVAVSVLEVIRRLKSDRQVSIKYPLDQVTISAATPDTPVTWSRLAATIEDLKRAANAAQMDWADSPASGAVLSEDGLVKVSAEFAQQSEVA